MKLDCVYRTDVHDDGECETAKCGLLASIVGSNVASAVARVPRPACDVCEYRDSRALLNGRPTFASLVYQATEPLDKELPVKDGREAEPQRLAAWAEKTLAGETLLPRIYASFSCDVVVSCCDDSSRVHAAVAAALDVDRVFTVVHVVGDVSDQTRLTFAENGRVKFHDAVARDDDSGVSWLAALLPEFGTQFVCTGIDCVVSALAHLGRAIEKTTEEGLLGLAGDVFDRDLGSKSAVTNEQGDEPVVVRRGALLNSPAVDRIRASLPERRCDVVLPFHGQFEFVEDAIASLLNQDRVHVTVHLVDDASPEDAGPFLRKWARDSRVRTYRNQTNIGQFMTFNNVLQHVEGEFVAVQDGDDISLPDRLAWSVDALRLTDADFFAAAAEVFESAEENSVGNGAVTGSPTLRTSCYPVLRYQMYFAENPTLVMRASAFRDIGGFADFGDRLSNRCSVDTELQMRALFAGKRFTISDRVVLKYRSHAQSATNDSTSGWGSPPRRKAEEIVRKRRLIFQRGPFDPRAFGGLQRYRGVTVPFGDDTIE